MTNIDTVPLLDSPNMPERGEMQVRFEQSAKELASFKFALDQSSIVAVTDRRGKIIYVNDKFCEISKYSREELYGQDHRIINSGYHRKEFFKNLWQTITGGRVWQGEIQNRAKDGSLYWVDTTIVPFLDGEGKPYQYVAIRNDITERKRAEEELQNFAARLERSNAELQDFASVASHDLQEPLRKVQAFGDRLKAKCGDALTDEGRDYLERMQNAASRMQTLINDLLTFSRVTSKAQPFTEVNLRRVADEVLSDLETLIETTNGRVEIGELATVEADPIQMRQLLQNLIGNALKFNRSNVPPVVRISGRICHNLVAKNEGTDAGTTYCLTVEDNGIGFDEKYVDRIFKIFQRLHDRSEYEGTGIGLAVCRKIADRHGGSITAQSAPGAGATFIVDLPVKQQEKIKQ